MADGAQRVRIEEADWPGLLPFIRIFRSFRMAVHPAKLFTALLLIVLLFLVGQVLDAIWGPAVFPEEVETYATRPLDEYQTWLDAQAKSTANRLERLISHHSTGDVDALNAANSPNGIRIAIDEINREFAARRKAIQENKGSDDEIKLLGDERRALLEQVTAIAPRGIFDSTMRFTVDSFERLMGGAISLNFGLTEALRGLPQDPASFVGAGRDLFVTMPSWLYHTHRGFLAVFCIFGGILWALFGGALCRMAALDAIRDQRPGPTVALRFALGRLVWLILAPLIPALLGLALALLLFLFGLVFFGLPYLHVVLDILGGLLFVIPLALGLVIALLALGLALGGNLLYPAIAVEGSDGFDANSRAFSYVVGRPWQLLFYSVVSLIYGAVTYLFIGMVLFLALVVGRSCLAAGLGSADNVLHQGGEAVSRFDAMLKPPQVGRLSYEIDWGELHTSGKVAAVLIKAWVYLFVGLLAAYAVSYFFCANTWIYLLLRHSADGTDFDEMHADVPPRKGEDVAAKAGVPPEKVDAGSGGSGGTATAAP